LRAPRIPADDEARVVALRELDLLDTGPEERFDRITRTASTLLGTPIALVNLVDDHRQWAKSAVGLAQGAHAPRDVSFCAHVVGDSAPVSVPELRHDDRFHDNPMVTDEPLRLRSYFGVPVAGPSGHVLGSLCVADREPRELTPAQLAVLADLAGWVEAELDRTQLARLTARERQARRRTEAITAAVGDGIVLFDGLGTVTSANPAAEELVAVPRGGLVGRRIDSLLADPDDVDRVGALLRAGELQRPTRREVQLLGPDGQPLPLEVTITSLRDERAFVATVRDVSARRQVERLKDEFVSTVSHELRTPLTSIKGTLGLVLAGVVGDLPAEAVGLLEVAGTNTDRLIRLVNDILDLERLAAGRIELSYAVTDTATLVADACGNVAPQAEAGDVHLVADVASHDLEVDADRIVQVLTNLLGNAVRFSPAGGKVTVEADATPDEVTLTVADEGRGIPATDLDRIFDRFGQVDASDSRERAGSGLGLPIARGLAERHHGRLTVDSEPGRGSRFHLVLPRVATATEVPS
jgi:PAS domain S-box-containing protein